MKFTRIAQGLNVTAISSEYQVKCFLMLRSAQSLLTDYSLLPLSEGRLPFQSLAFDPYTHIPHDPSHSELAGMSSKALELTLELLSKDGGDCLYF
jgi:hypothetical protein